MVSFGLPCKLEMTLNATRVTLTPDLSAPL